MIENISIRQATIEDAEALLKIYTPYILNTAITFETDVPTVEAFKERIQNITAQYPYLTATVDNEIVGYAYAHEFSERTAYKYSAEVTIYINANMRHFGLGKKLYIILEEVLKAQGILNIYSCVACPDVEDEYLTNNSRDFHLHLGYEIVGKFNKCGYKFNRWYNMLYMEKILGEHNENTPKFTKFKDLPASLFNKLGIRGAIC